MPKGALIVVVGPTASGKTDFAITVAQEQLGEIVSADSRQVYRGMDIGTAKVKNTRGIPHHLIDMREPNEPLTLWQWQQAAFDAIETILAAGKQPILVGGTMLYIDSVVYNFEIPRVKPNAALRELKSQKSRVKIYEELLEKDPEAKQFIEPGNTRRIIRALEVIKATGRPFSRQRKRRESRYEIEMIGLFPSWDNLKKRIEKRAKNMFAEGLLVEVRQLRERYGRDLSLLRTMHYRQAGEVLDGSISEAEAVAKMVQDNLRYAHRQMSWWRGRKEIEWRSV